MRASNHGSMVDDEVLVLAAGGCAEHEFGIQAMRQELGVKAHPSSISQVLEGRADVSHWPTTVDDYRVTNASGVVYLEMNVSVPASVIRRVAERVNRRGPTPGAQACKAYLESMAQQGKTRVPSLQLSFAVLSLPGNYGLNKLAEHFKQDPRELSGPIKCTFKELKLILNCIEARDIYVPDIEDLAVAHLHTQGYGPELTSSQTDSVQYTQALRAAWNSSNFCVVGTGADVAALRRFAAAFREGKAYCGLGVPKNPFARAGLVFVHECANTPELREDTQRKWAEHRELLQKVVDTGIFQLLKERGKRFYALEPELRDGELTFWLNPYQQDRYNYGWMTVQDLKDWAEDKGRVVKQAA